MPTYHIHISGMVQGVGLRPRVCQLAEKMKLTGWVNNSSDGVHIEVNGSRETVKDFYRRLLHDPPEHAIITRHNITETASRTYRGFEIRHSEKEGETDLLITPDMALCPQCRREMDDPANRRYNYPFTTCLSCGPRYSILRSLPYDRERTSMAHLPMCDQCQSEYENIRGRRHYSQTNSCPGCAIPMYLYNRDAECICRDNDCILSMVVLALREGRIVAVKGIGGYLLLTDARNALSIETLRQRKNRPSKPFAIMYPDIATAKADVEMAGEEEKALLSEAGPIVLCPVKSKPASQLPVHLLAPGLRRLGVMLPYSPLLHLIARDFQAPLVATSGNLSGSPIIYGDDEALLYLTDFSDFVLGFERDILSPQDDSVMQFSELGRQPVILRRSRGMAPDFLPDQFNRQRPTLAMGADMKGAFALNDGKHIYISQYLGDQEKFESQEYYQRTMDHLLSLLSVTPERIIIDTHPAYFSSALGRQWAYDHGLPIDAVQHHQAHFAAVLAENQLLRDATPVLGVIWDGTGWGDDGQIWGSEFFLYRRGRMEHVGKMLPFAHILGDKMSREPRLSALSLLHTAGLPSTAIRDRFSRSEWAYFNSLLAQPDPPLTRSMGRLIDGLAVIAGMAGINSYEAETAMRLEAAAVPYNKSLPEPYPIYLENGYLDWKPAIEHLMLDQASGTDMGKMAWKIWATLASGIRLVATRQQIRRIAFSGGVFQNALLVDLLHRMLGGDHELIFHRQLSPNDENIAYGQLALAEMQIIMQEQVPHMEPALID